MYATLNAVGSDVADAIREKDGTSALIPVSDFGNRIRAIPQGGSGETAVAPKRSAGIIPFHGIA